MSSYSTFNIHIPINICNIHFCLDWIKLSTLSLYDEKMGFCTVSRRSITGWLEDMRGWCEIQFWMQYKRKRHLLDDMTREIMTGEFSTKKRLWYISIPKTNACIFFNVAFQPSLKFHRGKKFQSRDPRIGKGFSHCSKFPLGWSGCLSVMIFDHLS